MGVYRRPGSPVYWYTFTISGRKFRASANTTNKKLAEEVRKKEKEKTIEAQVLGIVSTSYTFQDLAEKFVKEHSKPNKKSFHTSDERYLRNLIPFFGSYQLSSITPELIDKYRAVRRKTVTVATVNREVGLVRTMLNKALIWRMTKENPTKYIEFYKENNTIVRYLKLEEYQKLIAVCSNQKTEDGKSSLRDFVDLLLNTGMRKGEAQRLKPEHIDWQQNQIKIVAPKSGQDEYIPMNKKAREILSKPFDFNYNPKKSFKTALRNAGLDRKFRIHDLRHTFASWLVIAGVPLAVVMQLMRHRSYNMTLRYAHLNDQVKMEAVGKIAVTYSSREAVTTLPELAVSA